MSIVDMHIKTDTYNELATKLLGMLYLNQRLPSILETTQTILGAEPVVNFPNPSMRALYQLAYPSCNGLINQFSYLFGMASVDFQIHVDRTDDQTLTLILGFGEVTPHYPLYVTFRVEWCNESDFMIRNDPTPRVPWNINVGWSDEWKARFVAGRYPSPDLVNEIIDALYAQFDNYNGYHNAGITEDHGSDAHWFHCEHYSRSGMMPEGRGFYRLTTTIELREGAYDLGYTYAKHATVGAGEEWGMDGNVHRHEKY